MAEICGYIITLLMGVCLGIMGGGGSILTVPILFYFFDQDSVTATSNSLFIVGTTALIGCFTNIRKKNVELRTAALFAVPSFTGVYLARAIVLPLIPQSMFSIFGIHLTKPIFIMICFSSTMIVAARAMIRSGKSKPNSNNMETPSFFKVMLQGLFVGFVTGFVGAGGGFLIVPALTLLLGLPVRRAIGTSLVIISANSFFGFIVGYRALSQEIHWPSLITMTGIGVAGIIIGNQLADKIPEHHLKRGFGYFVLAIGSLICIHQLSMMI